MTWPQQEPETAADDDLWFLPGSSEDSVQGDMPWPVAPREPHIAPTSWRDAEAGVYRDLIRAAETLARYREAMRGAPVDLSERFALMTVSAILRDEGVWISPEQISLYRNLRTGADRETRDLARGAWALRRLLRPDPGLFADLRGFLGRIDVQDPQPALVDRPVGPEIDRLGQGLNRDTTLLSDCHVLTRAGFAFARWRAEGVTPWDELLEPTIAVLCLASEGVPPGLPMVAGHRLDRHAAEARSGSAEARLAVFYAAIEAGALSGLMELDRVKRWHDAAGRAVAHLSGRTPPALIATLMRLPVVSAELVASDIGCTTMSARRNLAIFTERGLVREITGQDRYRFWTIAH